MHTCAYRIGLKSIVDPLTERLAGVPVIGYHYVPWGHKPIPYPQCKVRSPSHHPTLYVPVRSQTSQWKPGTTYSCSVFMALLSSLAPLSVQNSSGLVGTLSPVSVLTAASKYG